MKCSDRYRQSYCDIYPETRNANAAWKKHLSASSGKAYLMALVMAVVCVGVIAHLTSWAAL